MSAIALAEEKERMFNLLSIGIYRMFEDVRQQRRGSYLDKLKPDLKSENENNNAEEIKVRINRGMNTFLNSMKLQKVSPERADSS